MKLTEEEKVILAQYRGSLISGYLKAPEILAFRLKEIFDPATSLDVRDSGVHEIQSMVGLERMPLLMQTMAKSINTLCSGDSHGETEKKG